MIHLNQEPLFHWITETLLLKSCIPLLQKQPPEVFFKKALLKNFAIFPGKHLCWNLFSIKLQVCNFIKKVPNFEYYEIFKNAYYEENAWTAASSVTFTCTYFDDCIVWCADIE